MASLILTVDDVFDISGCGLVVVPGPLERDWIGPRELNVRLRLPGGDERTTVMTLRPIFQSPPAPENRFGCILKGVSKSDVPVGTEVWTEGTEDVSALASIERQVRKLAEKIGAPTSYLPTFGQSEHSGKPHVEVGDAYFFVVCERGTEFERRRTDDRDELLFWVFSSVTFSMASDWEVRNRCQGEDSRRQLFAKQEELLAALSPEWAAREADDHRHIIERHPFRDV